MTGTYTEIVGIIAPSSAAAGATVNIEVRVRNLHTATIYISATGRVNGLDLFFGATSYAVSSGAVQSFHDAFIMPNRAVILEVWSWYWGTDQEWHLDDDAVKNISLGVVEEYKGTITKKELEYNYSQDTIPVGNVPQDERGKVHIWGRNDMITTQRMGIHWRVKDPNGLVVEDYEDWELWPYTGSGSTHEFYGDRFDLNKVGTYTISVSLSMNPDEPVNVDTFYGNLCVVVAEVLPAFSQLKILSFTKR